MATSPVPLWAQEMSPHHRGPTGAGVLVLAVVAILVALLLQLGAATGSGHTSGPPTTAPPPCATVWPPTCQEASGGH